MGEPDALLTSMLARLSSLDSRELAKRNTSLETDGDLGRDGNAVLTSDELAEDGLVTLKKVLLTLHFLFPHELLPSLDLLDRGLLSRTYRASDNEHDAVVSDQCPVFYVQSASAAPSAQNSRANSSFRFRNAWSSTDDYYEVRLDAWNCTCPAFAYSTLRLVTESEVKDSRRTTEGLIRLERNGIWSTESGADGWPTWRFGGHATTRESSSPICKHILAVALGQSAPHLFPGGMNDRHTSALEDAAWAAGWVER